MLTVCQKWHQINLKGLTYEYVTPHNQNWKTKAKNKLFSVRRQENNITLVWFLVFFTQDGLKKIQLLLNKGMALTHITCTCLRFGDLQ